MSTEYYPAQVGLNFYKLTKFVDGEAEPENVYFVTIKRKGEKGFVNGETDPQMHCDCPNRRRSKHINDKHGIMISQWLYAGKPAGFFDKDGEFHGTDHLAANPFDEAAGDPGADADQGDEEHE